jgi:glycosyltransferase involved in cell wall biosynthesis
MKILSSAKTNLNFDGRILSHLDMLSECFSEVEILFLLLPDNKTCINLPSSIKLKEFNFKLRLFFSKYLLLQAITAFLFGIYQIINILKYKPNIITVNDLSAALGPVLLSYFIKINIIYDDHELFERPKSFSQFFWHFIEKRIIKISSGLIVANDERRKILYHIFKPKCKITIITNHPFDKYNSYNTSVINTLKKIKSDNKKILLHQGRVFKERGLIEIKQILSQMPSDWSFCTLGVPKKEFESLFDDLSYDEDRFINLGYVNYNDLQSIWNEVDATIIIYKSNLINNRYCAPNRLFFALKSGIPIISNQDNPILSRIIKDNKNGFLVSENGVFVSSFFENYFSLKQNANLSATKFSNNQNKINLIYTYKNALNFKQKS